MQTTDSDLSAAEWEYLSALGDKRSHYSIESYFRDSVWDARLVLGERLFEVVQRYGLVVVKPEALPGRRVDAIMGFLRENRLTPVCSRPLRYTRHVVAELWRYQWNAATIEKMDIATRVNTALPTLLMMVRDDLGRRELPAPVRLKELKGASAPEKRRPNTLRDAVRAPNRLITFVHSADEPADVLRELGIFFDRETRRGLLAEVANEESADVTDDCVRELKRLEAGAPATDFDAQTAWDRAIGGAPAEARPALEAQRELFRRTGKIEWEAFLAACSAAGAGEWDALAIATAAVESDKPGLDRLIDFDERGIEAWRRGRGTRLHREP